MMEIRYDPCSFNYSLECALVSAGEVYGAVCGVFGGCATPNLIIYCYSPRLAFKKSFRNRHVTIAYCACFA